MVERVNLELKSFSLDILDAIGGDQSVIASVTSHFCGDGKRLRATVDGKACNCFFVTFESGADLRLFLEADVRLDALRNRLSALWSQRHDRYSEERTEQQSLDTVRQLINGRAKLAHLGG